MMEYLDSALMNDLPYTRFAIAVFAVMAHFGLSADMRQVNGYGSGDDWAQALCVAQGDAVLNAGAKTTVSLEANDVNIISDKSVSSNEIFLAEYKVLEKGDSFDGVYVRIQANVCEVSERVFDNGRTVIGKGKGASARAARENAIGNALMELGARVRSVGSYDKDELVKDETVFTGWAYVADIAELEKSRSGGEYVSKVKFRAFANQEMSDAKSDVVKRTSGTGRSVSDAMADARVRAAVDINTSYVARKAYQTGVLLSSVVKRKWRGFCYGAKLLGMQKVPVGWRLDLSMGFDDKAESLHARGIAQGIGLGVGKHRDDAFERAKWDVILNSGSVGDFSMSCEDGKEPKVMLRLVGSGYVGKAAVDYIASDDDQIAEIRAPVSRSKGNDSQCEQTEAVGYGQASDMHKAFLLARLQSLVNGGARYSVDRTYNGNNIVSNVCEVVARRDACAFMVEDEKAAGVRVRMKCRSGGDTGGTSTKGIGMAASEEAAMELARCDAALNFCSTADVWAKYENTGMIGSRQQLHGRPYLVDCNAEAVRLPDGRFLCMATADAVRDASNAGNVLKAKVSFEGRHADSLSASICATRRRLLIKAGATVDASMDYKDLELVSASAIYRAEGILSACQVDVSEQGGGYASKASGRVLSGDQADLRTGMKVFGYGIGASFGEARDAAVQDAVLNANSRFSAEERYSQGKFVAGQSKYAAEGYMFGIELLDSAVTGGRHVVKVKCVISSARKDELERAKKKVKVMGWGESEEAAKADAERNAIDAVFGREVRVSLQEVNDKVIDYDASDSTFEDGYVESSKVKGTVQKMGLYQVTISAVVRQKGKEKSGWGLFTVIAVICLLLGIIAVAREKL